MVFWKVSAKVRRCSTAYAENEHSIVIYFIAAGAQGCMLMDEWQRRLCAEGKPIKVALIAVANLLLRQIWAFVSTQKPFDN